MLPVNIVFRKTSFVDYPALVSAVVFFYGCNLRCPWCHNRELITYWKNHKGGFSNPPDTDAVSTDLEKALEHIEKRRKVLGGVVLSGGEPTLFPGLPKLIARVKALGLRVKIDTNGMRPDILEKLFSDPLSRPDYIAMDLKIAPERYAELLPGAVFGASVDRPAGTAVGPGTAEPDSNPCARIRRSAELIRRSGIAHEFRSLTLPASRFGKSDLDALAPLAGSSPWHIRPFVPGNCLDPAWDGSEPPFTGGTA
ncbi:MAG: anaerobic ribonucleoside-triphosphate reductase activating protein [Treponema sp.]|jgi:pyruvate formate lyase activating enzyme|nr:anaerobic ribonucleoside-triphosphate reductase activating protein [Treponema sp.]